SRPERQIFAQLTRDRDLVLAVLLREVQRFIGARDQVGAVHAVARIRRDADADGDVQRAAEGGERKVAVLDELAKTIRGIARRWRRRVGKNDRELFAAVSRDDVGITRV